MFTCNFLHADITVIGDWTLEKKKKKKIFAVSYKAFSVWKGYCFILASWNSVNSIFMAVPVIYCLLLLLSWCLMSSDVIWHIRDKLWPMPKHGSIRKVYACLAVTCHLHFWQNDRDFLHATAVTRGWSGYRNKSQHRKSTLEKKILPPFQQGFEPATFQSRVRCSNHWAIPAPILLINPMYILYSLLTAHL